MHEMIHYWCHVQGIKDMSRGNTYHNNRFKEKAEKRGLIITSAPLIGYGVTQPALELVNLVRNMVWDEKLKLYRSPKGKVASGKAGGNKDPGGDSYTTNPPKKKSSIRKYISLKCGLSIPAMKVVRTTCVDCGNI